MALAEPSAPRRTGPVQPDELAHAAVTAALSAAIALISVVVPFAAGISVLGTVPMGLLAYRYRLRVLVAATVAGGIIAFLVAGMGGFMTVFNCAYVGGMTGIVKRRGRGAPTAFAAALVAGLVFGAMSVGVLLIASRLRGLVFEAITAIGTTVIDLVAWVLGLVPAFAGLGPPMHQGLATLLRYWPVLMIALSISSITFVTMVGWWAMSRVLTRLSGLPDFHKLESVDESGPAAPVPVTFTDVRFRYPGTERDAVGPVSLEVARGEHLAVTGANGSGKTTLTLLMSGRAPSSGTVARPGAVGLGRRGGTAVVMQHPESQVLGTRVVDDVVWGLPPGVTVDVDRLLGEVGLDGLGERETGGLSGGELQRLAVAAAMAREPAVLIADEVTSMVDQRGRDGLMEVLAGLTRRHDMSLIHITHYDDEASSADRTIELTGNLDNVEMVATAPAPAPTVITPVRHVSEPLLELRGVGHEYASGTPWASTSLRDVEFAVGEGDGLLIHGSNGSGKSTLAWIMAGLLVPSTGSCLLDGEPVSNHAGAIAISFQAAHLQLMRRRVDLELASAGGFDYYDHRLVERALARVGLDPALGLRRTDQLSGGQMRRVVLAGLLARSPRAIILDEPLAGLDVASRQGLLSVLQDLRRDDGLTVIVISHDFAGLEELCPRTLHLHDGVLENAPAVASGAP